MENGGGTPLLARWTTDWDCGYETNWWYEICDRPLNIMDLKSDRRYKINKGNKNFSVREINPCEYAKSLYEVHTKAIESYPQKNRSYFTYENYYQYILNLENDERIKVYAAFFKETNKLCGFIIGTFHDQYFELTSQKADPEYEKYQVNAAMVYGFLTDNAELLGRGIYCNDGERSINHETNFQDYLEKYFGFRKAYCELNIAYNPKVKWIVKLLYPFRRVFQLLVNISIFHKINGVMKMEEIARQEIKNE